MNRKYTIEDMKNLAKERNGDCLSEKYTNPMTKLLWKCHTCNHEWNTKPRLIIDGSWCPKCVYKRKSEQYRTPIEEIEKIAKDRGGSCTITYRTKSKPHYNIEWQCASGHKWISQLHKVKSGSWCKRCLRNFTEEKCRYILENLTGKTFNPSKMGISLFVFDGYSDELKLAFEYNGEQHYHYVPHLQRGVSLKQRQAHDKEKETLCQIHNLKLIVIPYWVAKQGDQHLISFIINKLDELKIRIATTDVDMSKLYSYASPLLKLHKIAQYRGGKCLSTEYVNNAYPLKWECKRKHTWYAAPGGITRGRWCKRCCKRKTIEDMNALASRKGGKCLSQEYTTAHTKLQWQCANGHIWFAVPNKIQQGRWCLSCHIARIT